MAPTNSKANYRSYESQARMIRAIVAAHPEVKWNYKEIVACYGSDMTENALNHRFRRLKTQTLIIRTARKQGIDIKDMTCNEGALPISQDRVNRDNIAMYFGQSTADGIQFQFRAIKRDAEVLKRTVEAGGNPATALDLSGGGTPAATPSRGLGGRTKTPTSTAKRGRKTTGKVKPERASDAEDEDDDDYDDDSDREQSPSKRVRAKNEVVPIRMADLPRASTAGSSRPSYPTVTDFLASRAPAPAARAPSTAATDSLFSRAPEPPARAPSTAPPASIFGFRNGGEDAFAGNKTPHASFYGYTDGDDEFEI